jgi:4-diphosphocytidyl-2-C-methyl-D-erythritol kinase
MEARTAFRAYAKINLCLSVGAPIPEGPAAGFHPIASWMHCIDLYDEVTIHRLPGGESSCSVRWAEDAPCPTPIDWPLEKDLAARAHRAFEGAVREAFSLDVPVAIEVIKRIPVGAGLGGGSSDAAAVLLGLLEQGLHDVPPELLLKLCADLGSDVAFFADRDRRDDVSRPALVTGLGDQIRRVDPLAGDIVLIIPPYGCATGPVYKAFDQILEERRAKEAAERAARGLTGREKQTGPKESLVEARWKRMASQGQVDGDHLFNDLAQAAYRVEPRLGRLVTALSNATRRQAHVTGSGSCVFIPSAPDRTARLVERVEKLLMSSEEFAGTRVVRTRLP